MGNDTPLTAEEQQELEALHREDACCKLANHAPSVASLRRMMELEARSHLKPDPHAAEHALLRRQVDLMWNLLRLAPHGDGCNGSYGWPCTCWKQDFTTAIERDSTIATAWRGGSSEDL